MQHEQPVQGSTPIAPDFAASSATKGPRTLSTTSWLERSAQGIFLWPSLLVLLCFSIFPLIISLYLSFSRFKFVRGGFDISFVGLANYHK